MNKVILIGNVGQEPIIKTLDSGDVVAQFSVATSENYVDKDNQPQTKTTWHRIVAWNKTAKIVQDFVKKGSFVGITAKSVSREYDEVIQIPVNKTKTIDHTIKRYVTEFKAYDLKVY
jgi:single-strand DNA-binding protein